MNQILELMALALNSPLGIECETNNPETFKRYFYAARKKDIELFSDLACVTPPIEPDHLIWLIRKSKWS